MRVGIDYRPALVNREGIGRYTRELVRGMIELDFDRHLGLFGYTLASRKFSYEELGLKGTRAELLRLRFPSKWMPWLLARLGKGVDDLTGGAEVFHHTSYSRLHVRRAAEVATIHDCIYMTGDVGYVEPATAERMTAVARELVAGARRVLVPTEFVGAEVVLKLGVWPNRVSVVPHGCDHFARTLPPGEIAKAQEPYILTVSRVEPRKNHLRMLTAFELLVKEGLPHRWVIAGPPGYKADVFERALAASPARDRVEWRRFVPEAELPLLYARADLKLFASLNEGFGFPSLEAMAAGVAVVSSCVTSMPEVCGDAAILVEPTDSERIFEAARRILTEPELRKDFELRGRQQARRFTWRESAKHTLIAYQKATEPEEDDGPKLRRSI
ncbi:MAG: glycosyltransferase family 1 protein [Planctomycetota bacterium]|nr:glycosyltransferase family 1 protein [Planctomycetota bacterium]